MESKDTCMFVSSMFPEAFVKASLQSKQRMAHLPNKQTRWSNLFTMQ